MAGILAVADETASDEARRYALPEGHVEALTDEASLTFIAPVAQMVLACARPLPELTAVFRSGDGLPFADYGEDLIDSQARFTAPMFDRCWPTIGSARSRTSASASAATRRRVSPTSPVASGARASRSPAAIRT